MEDPGLYHFTPQAVAKQVGVSVQSVRRWAEQYKDFLSDSANPAPGKARLYTWADVETLRKIKEFRDLALPLDEITKRLSSPAALPDTVAPIVATQAPQESPQAGPAPLAMVEAITALQRQIDTLQQAQRPAWWWWLAGVVCGLGLAAIAELFALVATRGR